MDSFPKNYQNRNFLDENFSRRGLENLFPLYWRYGFSSQNLPESENFSRKYPKPVLFYEFWIEISESCGFFWNFLKIQNFLNCQRMLTSKIFIRPLGAGKMWYQEILECWIWPMNQILIGWINIQSDSIYTNRSFLATFGHFWSRVHRKMTKNGLISILTVAHYSARKWLANDCT